MPTKPRSLRHAVQIVHSQRHGKKVNQKIVQHFGSADSGEALDRLVSLAEAMRLELELVRSGRCSRRRNPSDSWNKPSGS